MNTMNVKVKIGKRQKTLHFIIEDGKWYPKINEVGYMT
jgi:hypothetical protein